MGEYADFSERHSREEQFRLSQEASVNQQDKHWLERTATAGYNNALSELHGIRSNLNSLTGDNTDKYSAYQDALDRKRMAAINPPDVQGFLPNEQDTGAMDSVGNAGKFIAEQLGRSLPQMGVRAAGAAAGAAIGTAIAPGYGTVGGFIGGAGLSGALHAGGQYVEGMERGYDAPVSALTFGAFAGSIESLLGGAPVVDKLLRIPGIRTAVSQSLKAGGKKAAAKTFMSMVANVGKGAAKTGLEEGAEEWLQTIGSQISHKANDPSFEFNNAALREQVEAFGGGFLTGGALGGIGEIKTQLFGDGNPDAPIDLTNPDAGPQAGPQATNSLEGIDPPAGNFGGPIPGGLRNPYNGRPNVDPRLDDLNTPPLYGDFDSYDNPYAQQPSANPDDNPINLTRRATSTAIPELQFGPSDGMVDPRRRPTDQDTGIARERQYDEMIDERYQDIDISAPERTGSEGVAEALRIINQINPQEANGLYQQWQADPRNVGPRIVQRVRQLVKERQGGLPQSPQVSGLIPETSGMPSPNGIFQQEEQGEQDYNGILDQLLMDRANATGQTARIDGVNYAGPASNAPAPRPGYISINPQPEVNLEQNAPQAPVQIPQTPALPLSGMPEVQAPQAPQAQPAPKTALPIAKAPKPKAKPAPAPKKTPPRKLTKAPNKAEVIHMTKQAKEATTEKLEQTIEALSKYNDALADGKRKIVQAELDRRNAKPEAEKDKTAKEVRKSQEPKAEAKPAPKETKPKEEPKADPKPVDTKVDQLEAVADKVDPEIDRLQKKLDSKKTEFPWKDEEDESRYFGTKVMVTSDKKGRRSGEATVYRALNNGDLVEVYFEGQDPQDSVRLNDDYTIELLDIQDNRKLEEKPTNADVATKPEISGFWIQGSKEYTSSPEGQKELARRGQRIALLKKLIKQYANRHRNTPYMAHEIESIREEQIDEVRDWLIQEGSKPPIGSKEIRYDGDKIYPSLVAGDIIVNSTDTNNYVVDRVTGYNADVDIIRDGEVKTGGGANFSSANTTWFKTGIRWQPKRKAEQAKSAESKAKTVDRIKEEYIKEHKKILEGNLSGNLTDIRQRFADAALKVSGLTPDDSKVLVASLMRDGYEGEINPQPIEKNTAKIKKPDDLLKALSPFFSNDKTRYVLHGAFIDKLNGKRVAVATAGRQLIVVPYKGRKKTGSIVQPINGGFDTIEGNYPDYPAVIPDYTVDDKIVINLTKELESKLRGLARVSQVMGDKGSIYDKTKLTLGSAHFLPSKMVDAIDVLAKSGNPATSIQFLSEKKPIKIATNNDNAFAIIMPTIGSGDPNFYMKVDIDSVTKSTPKAKADPTPKKKSEPKKKTKVNDDIDWDKRWDDLNKSADKVKMPRLHRVRIEAFEATENFIKVAEKAMESVHNSESIYDAYEIPSITKDMSPAELLGAVEHIGDVFDESGYRTTEDLDDSIADLEDEITDLEKEYDKTDGLITRRKDELGQLKKELAAEKEAIGVIKDGNLAYSKIEELVAEYKKMDEQRMFAIRQGHKGVPYGFTPRKDGTYYRTDEAATNAEPLSNADKRKLLMKLKKMLGDGVNLKFVDRIHEGQERLGKYSDRLVTIAEGLGKAEDTMLHEAVHAALDMFLTPEERASLLKTFDGNEEALAEGVINFANKNTKGIPGKVRRVFNRVVRYIRKLFGKERGIDQVNQFYDDLLGGKVKGEGKGDSLFSSIPSLAPDGVKYRPLPDKIEIDGVQRHTNNSEGKPIHNTVEGIRNFWKWFGDSKVVDKEGRPLVVYHGTPYGKFGEREARIAAYRRSKESVDEFRQILFMEFEDAYEAITGKAVPIRYTTEARSSIFGRQIIEKEVVDTHYFRSKIDGLIERAHKDYLEAKKKSEGYAKNRETRKKNAGEIKKLEAELSELERLKFELSSYSLGLVKEKPTTMSSEEVKDSIKETLKKLDSLGADSTYRIRGYSDYTEMLMLNNETIDAEQKLLTKISEKGLWDQYREQYIAQDLNALLDYERSKGFEDAGDDVFSTYSAGDTDFGWLASGAYFTRNLDEARGYATSVGSIKEVVSDPYIYNVYLRMENPFEGTSVAGELSKDYNDYYEREKAYAKHDVDKLESLRANASRYALQKNGYDGQIADYGEGTEWVAFNSTQIKSATENTGAFDKDDARIKYRSVPDAEYEKARKGRTKKETLVQAMKNIGRPFGNAAKNVFLTISNRLENISPKLLTKARQLMKNIDIANATDFKVYNTFTKAIKKMSKEDRRQFDLARNAGDNEVLQKMMLKYEITDEYDAYRAMMKDFLKRLADVGIDVGEVEHYHPRAVKDYIGLITYLKGTDQWTHIQKEIDKRNSDLGPNAQLTEEQEAEIADAMLRGTIKGIPASPTDNTKERRIKDFTYEMMQFYHDPNVALGAYIRENNNMIAWRKFLGQLSPDAKFDGNYGREAKATMDSSIGEVVRAMAERGDIKAEQEQEVKRLIGDLWQDTSMNPVLGFYRNLTLLGALGQVSSAVTQIQDHAWNFYKNGFWHTSKGIGQALFKKGGFNREDLTPDLMPELSASGNGLTSYVLSMVLKATGMSYMDSVGKAALANASLSRMQADIKRAKRGDKKAEAKVKEELKRVFDDKWYETMGDILTGDPTNENVQAFAHFMLSEFQPLNNLETPAAYKGNARFFYMLKTYQIKQMNNYITQIRRDLRTSAAQGKWKAYKQATKNMAHMLFWLGILGVGADALKDILYGREIVPEDLVEDVFGQLLGLSRWDMYNVRREGLSGAILKRAVPQAKLVDHVYKDLLQSDDKGARSSALLPVIGKFYYWHEGRGSKTMIRGKGKKKRESSGGGGYSGYSGYKGY